MLRDFRVLRRGAAAAVVMGASALLVLPGTHAAAATVSVPCTGVNTADVAALTAAITAANIAGGQTLSLGAGCTFTLTAVDNTGSNGPNGLPQITSTMTIQGNGDTITRDTASGNTPPFRYFETTAAGNLTITSLILTKGLSGFPGGAIYGVGPVTVIGSTLSDNGSGGGGGAIYDHGALVVTNSSFLGNVATSDGGGIDSASGVVVTAGYALTVSGSTFSANTATQLGGAISASNDTVIVNSTMTGNTGFAGGGVWNGGSTSLEILDSTIAGNTATFTAAGGGIGNSLSKPDVTVTNTIVADNTPDNCGTNNLAPVTDGGHNLENGTSCAFASNAVNAEPALGGLANNGGPTSTRAITSSSPAFGKGDPTVCAAAPPDGAGGVDQRGDARKTATCDIGAFEVAAAVTASPSPTPVTPSVPPTGAVPADSPGPSAGLVIAGAGILLLGVLTAIGRRRNDSVV